VRTDNPPHLPSPGGRGNNAPRIYLIELLVVVGSSRSSSRSCFPRFSRAQAGRATQCISNVRQLLLAASTYIQEPRQLAAGASRYASVNKDRWHGTRTSVSKPFDFNGSVLKRYLQTPQIKPAPRSSR